MRCVMCNVWKGSGPEDRLSPVHMSKLPAGLKTVNLSGGEPFLRDDLARFVRRVHERCPRARTTISTNGYAVDRIAEQMREIRRIDPGVRLAVSVDGVGPAHDRVRGTEGAFDRAIGLIARLRDDGFTGLRLGMTVCGDNVDQIPAVRELAERLGLDMGVVVAHGAETHLGVRDEDVSLPPGAGDSLRSALKKTSSRWLRSWRPKKWLRAHFAWQTLRRLSGRMPPQRCRAGEDFFFVQADGTVYSCSVHGRAMGNIVDQDWAEIWGGPAAEDARRFAARCARQCWMICTARSVYRARPMRVLGWVAWNKLLAHLRIGPVGRCRPPSPAV